MASLIRCIRVNSQANATDFLFWLRQWSLLYPLNLVSVSPLPYLQYQQDWNYHSYRTFE